MNEKQEDTLGIALIPEAKDKITQADADKVRALVELDVAKFRRQKAQFLMSVAQCDVAIAEQEQVLADLNRRVAGVDYPPPPAAKEPVPAAPAAKEPVPSVVEGAPTPAMGAPVGGAGK